MAAAILFEPKSVVEPQPHLHASHSVEADVGAPSQIPEELHHDVHGPMSLDTNPNGSRRPVVVGYTERLVLPEFVNKIGGAVWDVP